MWISCLTHGFEFAKSSRYPHYIRWFWHLGQNIFIELLISGQLLTGWSQLGQHLHGHSCKEVVGKAGGGVQGVSFRGWPMQLTSRMSQEKVDIRNCLWSFLFAQASVWALHQHLNAPQAWESTLLLCIRPRIPLLPLGLASWFFFYPLCSSLLPSPLWWVFNLPSSPYMSYWKMSLEWQGLRSHSVDEVSVPPGPASVQSQRSLHLWWKKGQWAWSRKRGGLTLSIYQRLFPRPTDVLHLFLKAEL